MIEKVTFEKTTYAPAPTRFEAGTPHIIGAVGLMAAINYVEGIGLDVIHAHECTLVGQAREALASLNSVRAFGPEDSAGILSFEVEGVHPHDVGRSEEHTSELQSLMRISYAVFCLKKKQKTKQRITS